MFLPFTFALAFSKFRSFSSPLVPFAGTGDLIFTIIRVMMSRDIFTRLYPFLEILDLGRRVDQYLLLRDRVISTYNGEDFFSEGISEMLCQYIQLLAECICICTRRGLCGILFGSYGLFVRFKYL